MPLPSDSALTRRVVTVPAVIFLFVVTTLTLPALIALAALVDIIRGLSHRTPWMSVRIMAFAWFYLLGELWALIALATSGLLPGDSSIRATYRLQQRWARWNMRLIRSLFGLGLEVSGSEMIAPGPIILLSRHASMIDTLLPSVLVAEPYGLRLRYVLKKELLVDPALDIAGSRLPNYFIDRGSGESKRERARIRELASDLGERDGVLIYPEGTRFSEEKRTRYVARLSARGDQIAELSARLTRVLPPRPGGTLAILEATQADVVVLAHRGLEGFARVRDIWAGDLVGTKVRAHFTRIPRSEIPEERSARVVWLFDVWLDVDRWVSDGV